MRLRGVPGQGVFLVWVLVLHRPSASLAAEVCSFCLLSAALRSECVCGCSCVCFSPRREWCWTLPTSLSLAPQPPSCSQTLPAAAHFPAPGENWRVSAGGSLISLLAPFWPSPTALLLFGTGHVQVSEKVGGREPGEEPAGSGHE